MANLTYSVISRSCNKLLIGKTYWKGVVLPSILFASSIINWDKTSVGKIQISENNVWRNILGCPGYTPVSAMRGDIGSSTMNIRMMKNKLKYARYVMLKGHDLLKSVFLKMYNEGKDIMIKEIKEYMEQLEIVNLEVLVSLNDTELLGRIKRYDTNKWLDELREKETLQIYSLYKTNIQEESFYDNSIESTLLFKSRSNTLKLNWRNRFEGGETICRVCSSGSEETLEHFLVRCEGLIDVRRKYGVEERVIADLLRFNDELEPDTVMSFIGELWRERKLRLSV